MANEKVIDEMASVKSDVRKRLDEAVAAILALAWAYRKEGFRFEDYPELDLQVNNILQALSDDNLLDAEKRARKLLESLELAEWGDESLEYAEREIDGEDALWRLDMHASHLKELLAGWIVVAAINGWPKAKVKHMFYTYINDPSLCKEWVDAGLTRPKWGTGYAVNVVNGMAVIGQDAINSAFQYASIQKFKTMGAIGYRTVRRSNYHCPFCDEMTKKIWPLDVVALPYHPRCVCEAIPVFENDARD